MSLMRGHLHRARQFALVVLCLWPLPSLGGESLRIATYNTSLHRNQPEQLVRDLAAGSPQARQIAEVLQRVRPDVVLLNEFDYDEKLQASELFRSKYLAVPQAAGLQPLQYSHQVCRTVNTGRPSGRDLNKDGKLNGPADAIGFGRHHGQYGMLLLSKYPIVSDRVRTFQNLRWRDMPMALLPRLNGQSYYDSADLEVLCLSSKSHWDVPVRWGEDVIHVLASHPTPPVFDGKEDRNGRRNYDEIRLWADYVSGGASATYLKDDQGRAGGLAKNDRFVILGDLNADPQQGDSREGAIQQLLEHPRIHPGIAPKSATHGVNTARFGRRPYRVDYVLPSRNLMLESKGGVFWPAADQAGHQAVQASDHRLVWLDVK